MWSFKIIEFTKLIYYLQDLNISINGTILQSVAKLHSVLEVKEMTSRGKYIAFAGIDGSGKSTQAELLVGYLESIGVQTILQEGKRALVTQVSTMIAKRHGCESGNKYLGEDEYLLCMSFDIMQEISKDVMPYTNEGAVVVVPRTPYCRLAGGLRRGAKNIDICKEIMLFDGRPDLVLWLDLPPEVARDRIQKRSLIAPPLIQLKNYRNAFRQVLADIPHERIECTEDMTVEDVHCVIEHKVDTFMF